MKVHMNIAAGYKKHELKEWFDADPDASVDSESRVNAVHAWASNRYGNWLNQNAISDFTIYEVTDNYLRIDFLHDTDALVFVSQIGGRILEE